MDVNDNYPKFIILKPNSQTYLAHFVVYKNALTLTSGTNDFTDNIFNKQRNSYDLMEPQRVVKNILQDY